MANSRKVKNIVNVSVMLAVFFGTPILGLNYFWWDMHRKIETNAVEPSKAAAAGISSKGFSYLEEMGTVDFRDRVKEEDFLKQEKLTGSLKSVQNLKAAKSWVRERDDQMWQFVRFQGAATTTKGPAKMEMVICRLYLEPKWLVDEYTLTPSP